MLDWLKGALAAVYSKDGLLGVGVVAGILFLGWYLFGADVLQLLGS